MAILQKLKRALIPAIYIIAMGWAGITGLLHPAYNWDMLCYVGSVISWSEKDPKAVLEKTMHTAKENIAAFAYEQQAAGSFSNDYTAFIQQIPFCQIKPLYTGLTWLIHQTGMPLPNATWTISSISFMAMAVLLFVWRPVYMHKNIWLLLVLAISFLWYFPLRELARYSTPDMLCTTLTMGAFYAILQKRSFFWFSVLGVLATLARPDAIIPVGISTVYFSLLSPKEWRTSLTHGIIMMLALLAAYIGIKQAFAGYTYDQYFIHSLIKPNAHPQSITQHLTLSKWWEFFSGASLVFLHYNRTIALCVCSILGFCAYYSQRLQQLRLWRDMLLLILLSWTTRFVLWPAWGEPRFYYTYSLMVLLTSGELMSPYASHLIRKLIAQIKQRKTTPHEISSPPSELH